MLLIIIMISIDMNSILLKFLIVNVYSIIFAVIEYLFRLIIDGYGYTTMAQYIISISYSPFIIQWIRYVKFMNWNIFVIFILFPVNIWIVELCAGFTMQYYFGYNLAWHYNTHDSLLGSNIRLAYYPLFFFLGIALYFFDDCIIYYIHTNITI